MYMLKELTFEEYSPFLDKHLLFRFTRLFHAHDFQDICYGISQEVVFKHQVLFSIGQDCKHMTIICQGSGELVGESTEFRGRNSFGARASELWARAASGIYMPNFGASCVQSEGATEAFTELMRNAANVNSGAYLGEASLWTHWEHCSSVRVVDSGFILCLTTSTLARTSELRYSMYQQMVFYGACFVESMRRDGCSDMGLRGALFSRDQEREESMATDLELKMTI